MRIAAWRAIKTLPEFLALQERQRADIQHLRRTRHLPDERKNLSGYWSLVFWTANRLPTSGIFAINKSAAIDHTGQRIGANERALVAPKHPCSRPGAAIDSDLGTGQDNGRINELSRTIRPDLSSADYSPSADVI